MYTCLIKDFEAPIVLTLSANNALRAGAKFGVFALSPANNKWEMVPPGFTLASGDDGKESVEIPFNASDLINRSMTWIINVCAFVPMLHKGVVKLEVSQGGKKCVMLGNGQNNVNPIIWNLKSVPSCQDGYIPINDEIRFQTVNELVSTFDQLKNA